MMFRHVIARITGSITAFAAFLVFTASTALAKVDPGLGEGSGSAPPAPAPSTPFEVFGMSWQLALALGLALIAAIGLAFTVQHRHHVRSQHV